MARPKSTSLSSAGTSMSVDTPPKTAAGRQNADHDDMSVTSSVSSDLQEEYEVETIYAQLRIFGIMKYLVKWKGYDDLRCTWEPAQSFSGLNTLRDWHKKRRAIERGELPAFDVVEWEKRLEAHLDAKDDRKRRRRAKRRRVGLPVSPSPELEVSVGENPAISGENNGKENSNDYSDSDRSSNDVPFISTKAQMGRRTSTFAQTNPSRRSSAKLASSAYSGEARFTMAQKPKQSLEIRRGSLTGSTTVPKDAPTRKLGTERPRSLLEPTIFGNSHGPTQNRSILGVISRSRSQRTGEKETADTGERRQWKLMSTTHRFEKASRYEPEPDKSQLDLRPAADWFSNEQTSLPEFRRRKKEMEQGNLFVEQEEINVTHDSPDHPSEGIPRRPLVDESRRSSVDSSGQNLTDTPKNNSVDDSRRHPINAPKGPAADLRRPSDDVPRRSSINVPRLLSNYNHTPRRPFDETHQRQEIARPETLGSRISDPVNPQTPVKESQRISLSRTAPMHRISGGRPSGWATGDFSEQLDRRWNKGDLLFSLSYDANKIKVGDARLCQNLPSDVFQPLVEMKIGHSIHIWVQKLCTLEESNLLNTGVPNDTIFNGWVEGYLDTKAAVDKFAKYLLDEDLVGIFPVPRRGFGLALLFYPRNSKSFSFLGRGSDEGMPLRVAARRNVIPFETAVPSHGRPPRLQIERSNRPERQGRFDWSRDPPIATLVNPKMPNRKGSLEVQRESPIKERRNLTSPIIRDISNDQISQQNTELQPSRKKSIESSIMNSPVAKTHSNKKGSHIEDRHPTSNHPVTQQKDQLVQNPHELPRGTRPTVEDVEMTDVGNNDNKNNLPSSATGINLDAYFKTNFDMTFKELAAVNGPKLANTFFLWFPAEERDEHDLMRHFLDQHRVIILSNLQSELDWERLAKSLEGVVLFHHSFLDFHNLPSFAKMIRNPQFNFWNVSLKGNIQSMQRSAHFQRLFPHGGVFLITEDLMLHEKDASIIILAWFRNYVRRKSPGTWKLMVRPDIVNWLVSKYNDDPRYKVMHILIADMVMEGDITKYPSEPEDLDPTSDPFLAHPIISVAKLPGYDDDLLTSPKGLTQEQRNTDILIEFFSAWCLINAPSHRRFAVVTTHELQQRWQNWHHIDLVQGPEALYKKEGIKPREWENWLAQDVPGSHNQV